MTTSQKVSIDGTQYDLAALGEDARAQLTNLRATDQEIARLQVQMAIAQTARAAYARALNEALPKGTAAETNAPAKKPAAKKAPAKKSG